MKTATIGIDNGSTGSVGIIDPNGATYFSTPTKEELHYSKAGKVRNRIDHYELEAALSPFLVYPCHAYIERPFTGSPMMINTMLLSARSYEATIIVMERLGIGYDVIDSKGWQAAMLPGVKGSDALKKASKLRGIQLYPRLAPYINRQGDADGLLIARHYHKD